jgi:spermidine synthase
LWQVSICLFLPSATGLVYEVLWIRMLALIFGDMIFPGTTVLTAFTPGLALGGQPFARAAERPLHALLVYSLHFSDDPSA